VFPVLSVNLNVPTQAEEEESIEEGRRALGNPKPEVLPKYSFDVAATDPAPVGSWALERGSQYAREDIESKGGRTKKTSGLVEL